MKVAIVGAHPRDPAFVRGGVEAVTLCLSEGLSRLPDVDVHVVVSEAGRARGAFPRGPNLTIHSIGAPRHLGNVIFALPNRWVISRKLREIRPDVVHAHNAHREALGSIESGLPTVVTIHGILEREIALETKLGKRVRGIFRRRLVRHAIRRAQNVILPSAAVADHYGSRLDRSRIWIIANPVDDHFFQRPEPAEPETILFSGLIIPRKGVCNLLAALDLARRRRPDVRLRIAGHSGTPAYRAKLEAEIRRLDLSGHVEFLGPLSRRNLAAEYARAAFVTLVSKQETLPVAIQEAMAVGRPVIASPVGGVSNVVQDGKTGFLVRHGDPRALAERMVRLLADPVLRERMGANARRIAEAEFRLEGVCLRTLAVYREVIAGPASTP